MADNNPNTQPASAPEGSADSFRSPRFILAPSGTDRWDPNSLRHTLALEPRIIPPPDPDSRWAKKFKRVARDWAETHAKIKKADAERAAELVCETIERYIDSRKGKIRMSFPFIEDDERDPWRVLRDALRQAAATLRHGPGRAGQAVVMQSVGERLIDFYERCNDDSDARFAPVLPMGQCLVCLATRLREYA